MFAGWTDIGAFGVGVAVGYLLGVWRRRWRHITIIMDADGSGPVPPHADPDN